MRTSKFKTFLTVCKILITVAAVAALVIYLVISRYCGINYEAKPLVNTAEELHNPYQGFYTIYGFRLSDKVDTTTTLDNLITKEPNQKLVLVEININHFSNSDISENGLEQLDTILSKWSQSGKQMILRFLYDWDGKNMETEPKDISQIAAHMEQIAPVVNKYADYIYIMQGIFVGDVGEMHDSKYLGTEDVKYLVNQLHQLIDPSIYLSVRTLPYWGSAVGYYPGGGYFPKHDGSLASRLGLFNDGLLGSSTDLGTYANITREYAIEIQNNICEYVPNGGEVVIDNSYNDLYNAIDYFHQIHISYLNCAHDGAVLDKWRKSTYYGTTDDCFNGVDGYTYIQEHLGYRYEIRSTNVNFDMWFDNNALFSCVLENVGFSPCLKELSVSFVIVGSESSKVYEIPISQDLRELSYGEYLRLTASVPVRDYESDDYSVYLKITDPVTDTQIKLATDLERSEYGHLLGKFTLKKLR